MGSATRHKPTSSLYGMLLHLYPTVFRQHFAATMEQTFDDMLDDTPSWAGRTLIWCRTIVNLPFSAAKEHVTDGKGICMTRNFKLLVGAVAIAVVCASAASFWFGSLHARQNADIRHVAVAQLGDAMQHDNFYSTYGDSALIFSARVASISDGSSPSVTFSGTHAYSVTCQFNTDIHIKAGQTMTVAAPGGKAVRQPHGILLRGCVEN
ncbi:MAG TPA: hypothetical protein VLF59_06275 [Candidatus Saccharimonadales bacterium]|nr:hypothetical protein [Candidatus Saccharimonadales bacterium]